LRHIADREGNRRSQGQQHNPILEPLASVLVRQNPTQRGFVPTRSKALKILVADDSPVYRKLIENTLLGTGDFSLVFAKSGREALAAYREHHPSILVTDWMMPDLTGVQLCQLIRKEEAQGSSYTYIVILTGNTEKSQIISGLSAGADEYLTKPFHPGELLARVGVGRRIVELQQELESSKRRLEELALTDALTGLPNRRAAEEWACTQLYGAERHGYPLWVAMADLDHFKNINDTYGHAAGDEALQSFAETLKGKTRRSDFSARIGGEEFLLILTHIDEGGVRIVTEGIRSQMAQRILRLGHKDVTITVSFGVAPFTRNTRQKLTDLLARADEALYLAKRLGRNRVELASSPSHGLGGATCTGRTPRFEAQAL
jgi:two-component system, cell cycle response regulator